jgi:chromosome segregation ATPase
MASVTAGALERIERVPTSPIRKLARFFKNSRDKWKAKYSEVRKKYRVADNKVRAVTKSRERWRQMAEQAQQEARRLREELESIKKSATWPERGRRPTA